MRKLIGYFLFGIIILSILAILVALVVFPMDVLIAYTPGTLMYALGIVAVVIDIILLATLIGWLTHLE